MAMTVVHLWEMQYLSEGSNVKVDKHVNIYLYVKCHMKTFVPMTINHLQELASQSPFGLNFTEEIALVWPAKVYFSI